MSGSDRADPPAAPASVTAIMAAIRHQLADETAGAAGAGLSPDCTVLTGPLVPPVVENAAGPVVGPVVGTSASAAPVEIDGTIRALLAPLLRNWLDAHLPELVETAVMAEIRRLTGQP